MTQSLQFAPPSPVIEIESDPSEHPVEPAASFEAQPLAIIPAPIPMVVPLRMIPSASLSPATSAPSAGSVTPSETRGPAPVPYHEYSELVQDREFPIGQNEELLCLLDHRGSTSRAPDAPGPSARRASH